jgi:hypothetical protein
VFFRPLCFPPGPHSNPCKTAINNRIAGASPRRPVLEEKMRLRKIFQAAALAGGLLSLAAGSGLATWSHFNRAARYDHAVLIHQQRDTDQCLALVDADVIRPYTTDAGCSATETVALAASYRDAQEDCKSLTALFAGTALLCAGAALMAAGAARPGART